MLKRPGSAERSLQRSCFWPPPHPDSLITVEITRTFEGKIVVATRAVSFAADRRP